MSRIGVAVILAALVSFLPAAGGGNGVSGAASDLRPRMRAPLEPARGSADADDITAPVPPRGTTREIVQSWTATIEPPRRHGDKPAPPRELAPARELLLTFDDGPDMVHTPLVLEELARHNLRAIFFVAGRRLILKGKRGEIQRALVTEMIRRGHLVANHTIHHVHLCNRMKQMAPQIDGNEEIITAATGVRPILFRAPFGDKCPELDVALAGRGLTDVGWNIDPQDWRVGRNPDDIVTYVKRKLRMIPHRAILLMHDTHRAGPAALGRILDFVDEENRRAATDGERPLLVRDYMALLPPRAALPETGAEPLLAALGNAFLGVLPR